MSLIKSTARKPSSTAVHKHNGTQPFFTPQTKLEVGKPGDKYEREADNVAEQVVQRQAKSEFLTPSPFFNSDNPFFPPRQAVQKPVQKKEDQGSEQTEIQEKPLASSITPLVQRSTPDAPPEDDATGQTPVQTKCADCEKKEQAVQTKLIDGGPVQMKCDKCAAEEAGAIQQKEATSIPIQRKEGGAMLPEVPKAEKPEDEKLTAATEMAEAAKEAAPADAAAPAEGGGGGAEKGQTDLPVPAAPVLPEPEIPEPIQEKSETPRSSTPDISSQLSASKGKGSPMSNDTRASMSESFGSDFSNVRIHTDSNAVQMNKELGSHAFTNGSDIYFNRGKYDPESDSGKFLLAHELTHTVQQGASGNNVQRFTAEPSTVTPEPSPTKPNDGSVMEGNANAKIDGDENVQNQDDLSEEEAEEKKNPPRDEVRAENAAVQSEGVTQAPVDRGGEAAAKIGEQKAQMNETLGEAPPAGEGEAKVEEGAGAQEAPAGGAQQAAAAEAAAAAVPIPETPQPFKQPNVVAPVDSAGEPIPRKANIDTQVRGLGYIGEMLRIKGYELKKASAEKTIHAFGLDSVLGKQREDLENARAGTATIEDHNEGRKEISTTSKEVLTDSKERQAFVAGEAPKLVSDADGGKADSGGLASEAESKASQAQSEIPDDEDARADAEQQSGEMNETADGAKSMDDAVTQTGERARQYIADAEQASADNQQSEAQIAETDSIIGQIDARVAEMKAKNDESDAAIAAVSTGPATMREQAVRTAQTGDELIAATIYMETELNSLQDEYLAGMAAIESKEAAEERIKKEQENQPPPALSPEEQTLFSLAAMSDEEQTETIQQMPEQEKTGLMAALEKMIKQMPDNGTDATEGARTEVKLGSITSEAPPDPRQPQIDAVDNQRIARLSGVLDVADVNMSYLSEEQQRMLAEKLVGESITDDIKNISVLQMGKDMIKGMIDPRVGLQGAIDGFGKTLSGVANIFNADAWAKDPLGNLLQIGADISTGLAMIFSSILGLAGMVTAVMVALIIISWGFATPFAAPVIGWMGTVMTYAGWGAIIAGALSVLFNRLAYIKNLNDAGTASTARELFGNTEQMKQNVMDGFTGAMSIVEGVGAVKMGPMMKSGNFIDNIPKSPGAFVKQTIDGAKDGLSTIKSIPANVVKGAKKLFASGKTGMKALKDKIKKFFSKSNKVDVDAPKNFGDPKKIPHTSDKNLGTVGGQKVEAEFDIGGGHKKKVLEDGSCATCSYCKEVKSNYANELDQPHNAKLKSDLDEIEAKLATDPDNADLIKQHNDIEANLERQRQSSVRDSNQQMINDEKVNNPNKKNSEIANDRAGDIKTNLAPEGMTPAQFREAKQFLKVKLDALGAGDAKVVSTGSRVTGVTTNPKKPNFGSPNTNPARDLDMRIITDKPISGNQLSKIQAEFKQKFGIELGIKATPTQQWPYIPKFGVIEVL